MLALVCGAGRLPAYVGAAQPEPPFICALEGHDPAGVTVDLFFRFERLGTLLNDLRAKGMTQVCMCGSTVRPQIDPSLIDAATMPLVPRIAAAIGQGDDGALRAIIAIFEEAGLEVLASQTLAPDLLMPEQVLTKTQPDAAMQADAEKGFDLLSAISAFDTGQACVVGQGQLLGVETLGGTDHLIASLPEVPQRKAAVLVKAPKTGQDPRVDWPAIGPDTITRLAEAGVKGLSLEAGGALILDRADVIAKADAAGIAIWARGAA